LRVSPRLQAGRDRDRTTGATRYDLTTGISAGVTLERFDAALEYAFTRYRSVEDGFDDRQQNLGLMLGYQVAAAGAERPGLTLFVNANWTESADLFYGTAPPASQIYVGLRTGMSPRFGGATP
jgi:hypothetical protein